MKEFKNVAAQGELLFIRRPRLPLHVVQALRDGTVEPEEVSKGGQLIVGHSETGHHHVFVLDRPYRRKPRPVHLKQEHVAMVPDPDDPLTKWLVVNRPAVLEHLRDEYTHEPLFFRPGIYEVRTQREATDYNEWRMVAD